MVGCRRREGRSVVGAWKMVWCLVALGRVRGFTWPTRSTVGGRTQYASALESMEVLYPAAELGERVRLGRLAQGLEAGVALRPDSPEQERTYGEFQVESVEESFGALARGLDAVDVLDVGSGTGRLAMCAALLFPEWTCRGVEIAPALHGEAVVRLRRAEADGLVGKNRVHFQCADVLADHLQFPDTNAFFVYATAFPAPSFSERLGAPVLNDQWTQALRRLVDSSTRDNVRIATTDRALDPSAGFNLVDVLTNVQNRETFGSNVYIHDVL